MAGYFEELKGLEQEVGTDISEPLVYAEKVESDGRFTFFIKNLGDLKGQNHPAQLGCKPVALLSTLEFTKGSMEMKVRIIHTRPSYVDSLSADQLEVLLKRIAQAVFTISQDVDQCVHVNYTTKKIWECPRPMDRGQCHP